jgi:hypothetical protein
MTDIPNEIYDWQVEGEYDDVPPVKVIYLSAQGHCTHCGAPCLVCVVSNE